MWIVVHCLHKNMNNRGCWENSKKRATLRTDTGAWAAKKKKKASFPTRMWYFLSSHRVANQQWWCKKCLTSWPAEVISCPRLKDREATGIKLGIYPIWARQNHSSLWSTELLRSINVCPWKDLIVCTTASNCKAPSKSIICFFHIQLFITCST